MSIGENLYIHILLSVIYKEYMVCICAMFSIITTKYEGNNMRENMDCDYKVNGKC